MKNTVYLSVDHFSLSLITSAISVHYDKNKDYYYYYLACVSSKHLPLC